MNIQLMIDQRQAEIRRSINLMAEPIGLLPAPIRWAAWLTGTTEYLHSFLVGIVRKRVARLEQECVTLTEIELLQL